MVPTVTYIGAIVPNEGADSPVLAIVMPVRVRVVAAVLLMAHAPPKPEPPKAAVPPTVSVRVLLKIAPVMRAEPIMKASGAPAMGIFVKVMAREPPAAMVPAVELNEMTKFWHAAAWHDGMVTELTMYPAMGPLAAEPAASTGVVPAAVVMLVDTEMPVSLPTFAAPRVRPLMVTV